MAAMLRLIEGEGRRIIDDRHGRSSVLSHHLNYLRWRNQRPGVITQRRYALLRLARFHDVDLLDVTSEQISDFRDRLTAAGHPLAPASQSAELAHLRSFFKWALLEDLIERDPMLRVPMPRVPRGIPHPIPEDELSDAIRTARDRIRPFFLLAAYAGLRACEIAPLRGDDIWWTHDPPMIDIRVGKGGDPGRVPLAPALRSELRALPAKGWLFPKVDGSPGHLQAWSVSHLANEHLHRIGSAHTLHSCRHRFGTLIYRLSGRDIRQTQELMRHRSIVSTAIYTQVDQVEAAEVVAALPRLVAVEERRAS